MKKILILVLFAAPTSILLAQTPAKDNREAKEREVVNDFWNSLGDTFKEEPKKAAEKPTQPSRSINPKSAVVTPAQPLAPALPAKPEDVVCSSMGIRKELDGTTWYLRSEDRKGWIKLGVDNNAVLTGTFAYGPVVTDEKSNVSGTISGKGEVVREEGGCDYVLKCIWKADNGMEEENHLHIKPGSGVIGTMDGSKKPWGGIKL